MNPMIESPNNTIDSFLTDKDIANIFRIHKRTVWLWAKIGKLPKPYKFGITTTRWSRNEIDEVLYKILNKEVTV